MPQSLINSNNLQRNTGIISIEMKEKEYDELAQAIAKLHLDIETLEERKSDSLDFHALSVWSIESALKDAIRTGYKHGVEMGQSRDIDMLA